MPLTRKTIPTDSPRIKDLAPCRRDLTREEAVELHAIKRLHQRYGVPKSQTIDLMMEHLAMVLAGMTEHRATQSHPHHRGNEIHRLWWEGTEFLLSYDPSIKRIVTYLPKNRITRKLDQRRRRRT